MIIEYGKRRTGKSVWTRDFMYKMRGQYYVAAIHTKTKFNGFFQKFVDKDYIYPDYYPSAMLKLFEKQKGIKQMKMEGELPEDLPTYAITWLDDVVSNKGLRYQESFVACATEGRHYDVCVGVNTQFVTGIPPSVRKNADIVVIFQQGYQSEKEMLAREYLGQLNLRTAMELIDVRPPITILDQSHPLPDVHSGSRLLGSGAMAQQVQPGRFLLQVPRPIRQLPQVQRGARTGPRDGGVSQATGGRAAEEPSR